jgi:hypothetical protein
LRVGFNVLDFFPFAIEDCCSSTIVDSSCAVGLSILSKFCICFFNDGRLDLFFVYADFD